MNYLTRKIALYLHHFEQEVERQLEEEYAFHAKKNATKLCFFPKKESVQATTTYLKMR